MALNNVLYLCSNIIIIFCQAILTLPSTCYLIFIVIIQEVQQINVITFLNQKQIMTFFNIRFQGRKVWNPIDKNIKRTSLNRFQENTKIELLRDYWTNHIFPLFLHSDVLLELFHFYLISFSNVGRYLGTVNSH